jgi:hypothetical protein
MSFAGASAAACSLAGSAIGHVATGIAKPIEAAAKHPKAAKTALGGLAAAPFVADYIGDEDDGFDDEDENEVAQP